MERYKNEYKYNTKIRKKNFVEMYFAKFKNLVLVPKSQKFLPSSPGAYHTLILLTLVGQCIGSKNCKCKKQN